LLPAPAAALGAALAEVAGGARAPAAAAEREASKGRLDLACQLVELAAQAAPEDETVHAVRAAIYGERRDHGTSLMARGIYGAAARESEQRGKGSGSGSA
jgi:hypothetical protein